MDVTVRRNLSGESSAQLQVVSVVDAAAAHMQDRILNGEMAPGERVREAPLAGVLGVSRHTLRAALSRLENVGLLRYRENRGWSVPVLERSEYEDILLLRETIENAAYRVILRDGIPPSSEVDGALARLVNLDEQVTWPERIAADADLHQTLVDLAGSERLSRAFSEMLYEFRLCRLQSLTWLEQLGWESWKQLHVDLVESIRVGDISLLESGRSHHSNDPWKSPRE